MPGNNNTPINPTPEVPNNPTPEPSPVPEVPSPTPEPEVPSNPVEDNKPNAPVEESKPDLPVNDTKSSVVQEGGTPPTGDGILAYAVTLFGSIMSGASAYVLKKKESE